MSLLFNTLSRFVIAFLPRSKHLLLSLLQSLFAGILTPRKIKSVTVYVCVCVLVAHLGLTISDLTDCSLPGSSLHGILQARILEWVAKINMIVTWLKSQFSHPDKDQIKLMRQLGIHRPKSRRRIIVRGPKNGRSPGS